MATYKTPGVYIEETSLIPSSVGQVSTAIPAFIGYTEKQPAVNGPIRINSLLDYEEIFGGPDKRILVNITDADDILNVAVNSIEAYGINHILYYSIKLYFDNGGGPCYVVSAGIYPAVGSTQISITALQPAIAMLETEDEPTLLVLPEAIYISTLANWGTVATAMLDQCELLQDRFVIFDTYTKTTYDHATEIANFRSEIGTQNLKYAAVYYPRLNTNIPYRFEGSDPDAITVFDDFTSSYISLTQFLIDYPTLNTFVEETVFPAINATGFNEKLMILPPSGAIAGVYATVDRTRGVWKAPANISLNSVVSPSYKLTDAEQGEMNIDPVNGKSINAIRSFTGKGIMIWGARTLDGNSNEWRYVPVRRLFITIEESLKKATQDVIFESNNANTWLKVKNLAQNFLNNLWRQGALSGAKAEDAFYVNVGLGSTMTPADILEGRLIIEVGLAAVRPAEFIVIRFSHLLQQS